MDIRKLRDPSANEYDPLLAKKVARDRLCRIYGLPNATTGEVHGELYKGFLITIRRASSRVLWYQFDVTSSDGRTNTCFGAFCTDFVLRTRRYIDKMLHIKDVGRYTTDPLPQGYDLVVEKVYTYYARAIVYSGKNLVAEFYDKDVFESERKAVEWIKQQEETNA